ncbi:hypothetical protein BJV77DRAFT_1037694, partial [Russula vinacea]
IRKGFAHATGREYLHTLVPRIRIGWSRRDLHIIDHHLRGVGQMGKGAVGFVLGAHFRSLNRAQIPKAASAMSLLAELYPF